MGKNKLKKGEISMWDKIWNKMPDAKCWMYMVTGWVMAAVVYHW